MENEVKRTIEEVYEDACNRFGKEYISLITNEETGEKEVIISQEGIKANRLPNEILTDKEFELLNGEMDIRNISNETYRQIQFRVLSDMHMVSHTTLKSLSAIECMLQLITKKICGIEISEIYDKITNKGN